MRKIFLFFLMLFFINNIIQSQNSKKALLVIDVQEDFFNKNGKLPVDEKTRQVTLNNINKIIEKLNKLDFLVIYIGNEFKKNDKANKSRNFAAIKGSSGAKLFSGLKIINNNYFSKDEGNAFSSKELNDFLISNNIDDIYIVGVYASYCVFETAKGAKKKGYNVIIFEDGIADKDISSRNEAIKNYLKNKIMVLSISKLL